MTKRELKALKNLAKDVQEIERLVSSGTGDGRIPAAYRPKIKQLAEAVANMTCKQECTPIKIFLEDDLVTSKDIMLALSQGCKIKSDADELVWLNVRGEICKTGGLSDMNIFSACREWTVVGEYDWYQIGRDLADGYNMTIKCMCKRDNGWFVDDIVGYAPQLDKPYIGKTKSFYAEVIILSSSPGYALPLMEVM
ncbi:MAG: hypothetical protein DRN17_04550 [Thermoplasmata archaeon]|nr:MAG: hypothetical protein DRN17_04550 [Thermoplasmata archaeon]